MAGPWEKYSQAQASDDSGAAPGDGPWSKYNGSTAQAPAAAPGLLDRVVDAVKGAGGRLVDRLTDKDPSLPAPIVDEDGKILNQDEIIQAKYRNEMIPSPLNLLPQLAAGEGAGLLARAGVGAVNAAGRVAANSAATGIDAAYKGQDGIEAAKHAGAVGSVLEGLGLGAGLATGAGKALAPAVEDAGAAAKSAAEQKAFKAAVGNQAKAYNDAAAAGVINDRGRELLDQKIVTFGSSAATIAKRAKAAAQATGQKIGNLLSGLDEGSSSPAVDGGRMAAQIREYADSISGSGNKSLVKQLQEAADDLEDKGQMSFEDAAREKASWAWDTGNSVPKQVARRVKGIIGDEMEAAVGRTSQPAPAAAAEAAGTPAATDAVAPAAAEAEAPSQFGEVLQTGSGRSVVVRPTSGPMPTFKTATAVDPAPMAATPDAPAAAPSPADQQQAYQKLKSQYGTFTAAAKDAQVNANRYAKNNSASLGDKAAAAAGAALNPHGTALKVATGFATGAANKVLRKSGNSMAAVGLDKIGDMLKASPEAFGKYATPLLNAAAKGEQSLAVTHFILMQQDHEYQQLMTQGPPDDDRGP